MLVKLFDKLGVIVEVEDSSESLVKLQKVYVWMPWHQEPTKDVAKLRKAPGRRKQSLIRGCPRFGNDTK